VDLDRGTITVRRASPEQETTKTATSMRTVPIPAAVIAALTEWKSQQAEERTGWPERKRSLAEEFVFTRPDSGEPWDRWWFLRVLQRRAVAAGHGKVTIHQLRHFAATAMLEAGIHVKAVAEMLGHADASTALRIYAHATESAKRSASDALASTLERARG
jgi:integrase